jgi:hypothetical protein
VIEMSEIENENENETSTGLREEAIAVLKKRRDFHRHVAVYLLVNTALVVTWAMTNSGGFFWPVFVIVFGGIGVVMNGWDAYSDDAVSERRIEREVRRLEHRR